VDRTRARRPAPVLHGPGPRQAAPCDVYSNAKGLGAIARIVIAVETGTVLDKGYIPR
jgi:hypothetical protein